jgi:NAD+ kinase
VSKKSNQTRKESESSSEKGRVTIGVVARPGHERALSLAEELIVWCRTRGYDTLIDEQTVKALRVGGDGVGPEEIVRRADPIVTLGGDGTLIGIARYVIGRSPKLVGVNFGHLGFLTEVAPEHLFTVLEEVLNGSALYEERALASAQVIRNGSVIFSNQAVNDVVVQKGSRAKLLDFDFAVDGEDVARIRADGIIMATPTGSTAYSLAAGGSIAHPSLAVFLVTPICPHSLTNRPLVLPAGSTLTVEIGQFEEEVWITIDGQVSHALMTDDIVRVKQAQQTVKFVRSKDKGYFEILRTKLNWGVPNRSD